MPVATVNGRTFLFIHIPKTGGMALSAFLKAHAALDLEEKVAINGRLRRARHFHGAMYEQLFEPVSFDWSFVVVRHPVAKLISEYTYQTRKSGFHIQNFMPFSLWLRYSLAHERLRAGYRNNHFRPQTEFLCFDCEVFRFEDGLDRVAKAFSLHAGLPEPASIEHRNRSRANDVPVSRRDLDLIERRYAADFSRFGYKPEEY